MGMIRETFSYGAAGRHTMIVLEPLPEPEPSLSRKTGSGDGTEESKAVALHHAKSLLVLDLS
jgi:hypothetical protein